MGTATDLIAIATVAEFRCDPVRHIVKVRGRRDGSTRSDLCWREAASYSAASQCAHPEIRHDRRDEQVLSEGGLAEEEPALRGFTARARASAPGPRPVDAHGGGSRHQKRSPGEAHDTPSLPRSNSYRYHTKESAYILQTG
jgi:hypothetical protein